MIPFWNKTKRPAAGAAPPHRAGWAAWAIGVVGATLLAGIGVGAWWLSRPVTRAYYADGMAIREPVTSTHLRTILWQPPVKLSTVVNTSDEDYEPRWSWDERTLFLVRGKPGTNADIYIAHRTPTGFTTPEPLTAVCSAYDDLGPEPSRDGLALYFYSNRPGGLGGYDLWVARCDDGQWQPPTNLGSAVNTEYNEYGAALSPDGRTLYFASNRPRPQDTRPPDPNAWPATVREDVYRRTYDLYQCTLDEHGPGAAVALDVLNTEANDGAPCVTPGGDFLYFASDRPGGLGGFDLYRARFVNGRFRAPENLGPTINSSANELDPGLTSLGFGLHFSSDRPRARLHAERPNDYDLYYSASRDVFLDTELVPRTGPNWAALSAALLPNLLWGLLGLLLLLLLIALWRDARRRQLGLLARCLLASLAVHALLMMALNFWRVTAVVIDVARGRQAIQVALAGNGTDTLSQQIYGALTELTTPRSAAAAEIPAPGQLDVAVRPAAVSLDVTRSAATADRAWTPPVHDAAWSPPAAVPPPATPATPATLDVGLPSETPRTDATASESRDYRPATAGAAAERSAPVAADEPSPAVALAPVAVPRSSPAPQTADYTGTVAVRDAAPPTTTGVRPLHADTPSAAELTPASLALPGDAPAAGSTAEEAPAAVASIPPAQGPRGPAAGATEAATTRPAFVELPTSGGTRGERASLPLLAVITPGDSAPPAVAAAAAPPPPLAAADVAPPLLRLPTETSAPPPAPSTGAAPAGGTSAEDARRSRLRGHVTSATTDQPLAQALVRIDLADAAPVATYTDAEGRYELQFGAVPEHFAVTASHPGALPKSENVAAADLRGGEMTLNFRLDPRDRDRVVLEPVPDVHHLGNDLYEGAINSQFQKESEGRSLRLTFAAPDVAGARRARLTMLTRGVQCPHPVRVNDILVARLGASPPDGSFGRFTAVFDPAVLRAEGNVLQIRATSCTGDIDDFEFVNVQIELER